jgi:lipopolysaccharide/colanic/teichoic acid biosynthesis glycosyltransferase
MYITEIQSIDEYMPNRRPNARISYLKKEILKFIIVSRIHFFVILPLLLLVTCKAKTDEVGETFYRRKVKKGKLAPRQQCTWRI